MRYADQIFQLGEQMAESLGDDQLDYTLRLSVGIADALPKTVSFHMIEPILSMQRPVRLVCQRRIPASASRRTSGTMSRNMKLITLADESA